MPTIDHTNTPALPASARAAGKPLHRIENTGGNVQVVADAINQYPFQRLVYAEGDSWFDKFTPLPLSGMNLLDALRVPAFAGLVDVSHIGDVASDMVSGWQHRQTKAMFKLFDFDAILLSAGGNDLKNLFADLYHDLGQRRAGLTTQSSSRLLDQMQAGTLVEDPFDKVMANIRRFIALRDNAGSARTRAAPLVLHGYDYLQPRPAPAQVFAGSKLGAGPWLHPALTEAGMSDAAMLAATRQVIDRLNDKLRDLVASFPADAGLWLLDQRGLLTLAAPGSTGKSGDWQDEIHPTPVGHAKLAEQRWNPVLAKVLGLI